MGILKNFLSLFGNDTADAQSLTQSDATVEGDTAVDATPLSKPGRNKWGIQFTGASQGLVASPKSKAASVVPGGTLGFPSPNTPSRSRGSGSQPSQDPSDKQMAAIARMEAMIEPDPEWEIPSCDKCEHGVRKGATAGSNPWGQVDGRLKGVIQGASVSYCGCKGGKIARGELTDRKSDI